MIDSEQSLVETAPVDPELNEQKNHLTFEQNIFHQKIAERLNIWSDNLIKQGKNIRREIYRSDAFGDDWKKVDPVDYICHRLSVIGLVDGKKILPQDVASALSYYREQFVTDERITFAQECYAQFNLSAKEYGLEVGTFDPNRLFFLNEKRIIELAGSDENTLGYTIHSSVAEILIPIDDVESNSDPNQLYDIVVHELGHQARTKKGLDKNKNSILEEGIVQAQARLLERTYDRVSRRTNEIYDIEAQVAEQLASLLELNSLFGLSHQEIRGKMREKYMMPGQVDDPYDDLVYDLSTKPQDLVAINRRWGFDIK